MGLREMTARMFISNLGIGCVGAVMRHLQTSVGTGHCPNADYRSPGT
jgi:hypothetical protein